ncbi:MAG: LamG-like jellyroll fold domain-containing protein [Bacteroidota bacterium]|nr:LamG-like jellyroll fold domain-containing protein [Bacteroidota bacterium]
MRKIYPFMARMAFIASLLFLCPALARAQYPEITADANTVLLEHFNQSTAGTLKSTLSYSTSLDGLGEAANFTDNNFVRYPASTSELSNAATIEFWVKPTAYNFGLVCINWSNTTTAPGGGYVFHSSINSDGKITTSSWNGHGDGSLTGNTVLPLNAWTHVAISWASGSTKIYINGKVDAQIATSINPSINSSSYVYLPYWGNSNAVTIDELHISKVQRTDAEIASRIPIFFSETQSDANSVILDHFNQTTTGTVTNTLNYSSSQNGLGKAANFTNNSFVRYPATTASLTNAATIEFWVKPESYNYGLVCINWANTTVKPSSGYVFHSSVNEFGKITMSSWNGAGGGALTGNTVLPLNIWTHVALSWGAGSSKIYINGRLDAQSSVSIAPSVNSTSYVYLPYWGNANPVTIDELHVSKVQRADSEIASRIPITTSFVSTVKKDVSVYPNPAKDVLFISAVSAGTQVKVFSLEGQELINTVLESNKLNVAGLSGGIYLLQLGNGQDVRTVKFIKQ